MKYLALILLSVSLAGCYSAAGGGFAMETLSPTQDMASAPRSGVSYEMYSWYNGQEWAFALTEAATGVSTFADITSAPDTIVTVQSVAQALQKLPRGTKVYWNLKRIKGFSLPADDVVDKLVSTAKKSGVDVEVIAWM